MRRRKVTRKKTANDDYKLWERKTVFPTFLWDASFWCFFFVSSQSSVEVTNVSKERLIQTGCCEGNYLICKNFHPLKITSDHLHFWPQKKSFCSSITFSISTNFSRVFWGKNAQNISFFELKNQILKHKHHTLTTEFLSQCHSVPYLLTNLSLTEFIHIKDRAEAITTKSGKNSPWGTGVINPWRVCERSLIMKCQKKWWCVCGSFEEPQSGL